MDKHADLTLKRIAEERRTRFYGKYRGEVLEALSGSDLGKLKVSVPAVLHNVPGVAFPCVPFAGGDHGFVSIPEKGDRIWIEFEGGNPAHPIWVGCWWLPDKIPSQADIKVRCWVTTKGLAVVMDDDKNEISLQHPDGPSITLSSSGITLSTDSATITLDDDGITIEGDTQVNS